MAKNNLVKPEEKLPTMAENQEVLDLMDKYSGKGLLTDASENLVPMLRVLHYSSPQVMKKDPQYIDGAEAGDILLKGAHEPLVKGSVGFLFQPAYVNADWVKWTPRTKGGGFLGRAMGDERHPPPDAKEVKDPQSGKQIWKDAEGNDWIFTRYWTGFVLGRGNPMPFVIPFTSTGHTVAKQWMTKSNQTTRPGGSRPIPLFGAEWLVTTKNRKNISGDWFVLEPNLHYVYGADPGRKNEDIAALQRGDALSEAFSKGERRMEDPEDVSSLRSDVM